MLQFNRRTWKVVGLVCLGNKVLPTPHNMTWVDEGVIMHMGGREGLDGQVGDPVT